MRIPSRSELISVLHEYRDPHSGQSWVDAGCVQRIDIIDGILKVHIRLGYAADSVVQTYANQIRQDLITRFACTVEVQCDWAIERKKTQRRILEIGEVKQVIAVGSGKGGVGKSTVAVNLALALQAEGAKVGILDADIYGPSQAMMLGVDQKTQPKLNDKKQFIPIQAHGIASMSMAYLVNEHTPMVWRGPMSSSAFQQLALNTCWGNLDYLIVDLPPGTGDIPLTLAKKIPITSVLVVTTAQEIALMDVKKGIETFQKIGLPVVATLENMSTHLCSHCGKEEHIFGQSNAVQALAKSYKLLHLGSIPLSKPIRVQSDLGVPIVVHAPHSDIAVQYRLIARTLGARIVHLEQSRQIQSVVQI